MIYLDNAATSWPKPERVYQTMDNFLRTQGGNPGRGGHSMAITAGKLVDNTRLLLANMINTPDKDRVIFTLNCTDSLNIGLKGVLRPGDHVITSSIEHNSVIRPLRKLEQRGVRLTVLTPRTINGFVTPDDIEDAILGETKLVVMTHASNVNGVIQPIEDYGLITQRHNLIFMVDAAQTAGRYPLDVQINNIDLLAFSGHKGLFGPPGTGVLYISERVDLDTLREGGTGSHSELEEQPDTLPYKFECGTANTVGIAGLGAGVEFIQREGIDRILTHEQSLTSYLIEGLSGISGINLYTARESKEQAPIISFTADGIESGELGAILDQAFDIKVRAGLHCAPIAHKTYGTYPRGTIRLSPGYFNNTKEIESTVKAIERIAKSGTLQEPCTSLSPEAKQ